MIAKYIVNDAEYYNGYYSALEIQRLITQPALREQVVISKQIKPSILKINENKFQFILHNKKHFFGKEAKWIHSFSKIDCSDLEKTFVDCLELQLSLPDRKKTSQMD